MRTLVALVLAFVLIGAGGCLGPGPSDRTITATQKSTTTPATSGTQDPCDEADDKDSSSTTNAANSKVDIHTNIGIDECPYRSYRITVTVEPRDGEATFSATDGHAKLARGDGGMVQQADMPASSSEPWVGINLTGTGPLAPGTWKLDLTATSLRGSYAIEIHLHR